MKQLTITNKQSTVEYKKEDFALKINSNNTSGFDCIRIKGKMFFRKEGSLKIPAGTEVRGVFVGVMQDASRVFYKDSFAPSQSTSVPDCASCNGLTPDSNIESPIAQSCESCPYAEWGSKSTLDGTKTKAKACREYIRTVLYVVTKQQKKLYRLDIPTMSMENFIIYDALLRNDVPPTPLQGVWTAITFDMDCEYAKLVFDAECYLNDSQFNEIRNIMKDPRIKYLLHYGGASDSADVVNHEEEEDAVKTTKQKKTVKKVAKKEKATSVYIPPVEAEEEEITEVDSLEEVLEEVENASLEDLAEIAGDL